MLKLRKPNTVTAGINYFPKKKQALESAFALLVQEDSLHEVLAIHVVSKCLFLLEFQVFFLNLLISRHGISNVILEFTAYIKYGTPCLKCFVHGALYFMHTVCTWGFNEFVQTGFSPFSNLFDRKSLVGNEKMLCFVLITDFLFIFAYIFNYYRRTRCH